MNTSNRLSRTNRPDVKCAGCGKLTTRNAGNGNLCRPCNDQAGLENEHNDSGGTHYGESRPACPKCAAKGGVA